VVSDSADLAALFAAVPDAANGLCFCTGSFGARRDNDLPVMVRTFGSRIGFLHLRSVALERERSFHEAAHLEGDAHMADVVREVHALSLAERRRIPMRPDHGHQMLDDLRRQVAPGYSLLGRMRGLAELRGLELGIAHMHGEA
jgi:mannonate dehydratase